MFQARDYSIFLPSPNAERSFRRLRRLDILVNGLIVLLIVLSIWNIVQLVQLRGIGVQDLAHVTSITDDLSTRLIWIFTPVTLGLILVREFLIGERTIGVIFPLAALLTVILIPAAMTEIQPPLQDQTLRVVMNDCPPKSIVNGQLSSIGRCNPRAIDEEGVLLALSDPTDGSFTTIEAVGSGQNTITYSLNGRGTYTVYFMFRFDDMEACKQSTIFPRGEMFSPVYQQCMEHAGAAWNVLPHTTAANMQSGVHLVQVTLP